MRRVLVAVAPAVRPRIGAILRDCELRFAGSPTELLALCRGMRPDLVLVGVHFNSSRTLDAVQQLMAVRPDIPIVCLRGLCFPPALGGATLDALRFALAEIGVHEFIDLLRFPDDALGNARVRVMLDRVIAEPRPR